MILTSTYVRNYETKLDKILRSLIRVYINGSTLEDEDETPVKSIL